MTTVRHIPASTCLGCGCTCDDIELVVQRTRIVEARNACTLGLQWYGNGTAAARVRTAGRDATLSEALGAAAALLRSSRRPLVYLAADVSSEAQREAVALADGLHARIASLTSQALPFVIAAQERGHAGATLGEIRNRADVIAFWGVDPDLLYPRFRSRYAVDPHGLQVPEGRQSRTLISVSVGGAAGPADADVHVTLAPDAEIDVLIAARSLVNAANISARPETGVWRDASILVSAFCKARYLALVVDGEGGAARRTDLDMLRADALISLTQELNSVTRAALIVLRGGGNRAGAEAVLTSQTGYPLSVDFASRSPIYHPHRECDPRELLQDIDATLIVGVPTSIDPRTLSEVLQRPSIAIGPRASEIHSGAGHTVIDCGTPGIHAGGTVARMDDVPIPVRAVLAGPADAATVLFELRKLCRG